MKNYIGLLLGCLIVLTFSACAQTSFIKRAGAYASERKTGTELTDENGNPVQRDTARQYSVYIELSGPEPEWKNGWYKDQMFSITATKIDLSRLEVGIDKHTGKTIIIQPKPANQLWQLDLLPNKFNTKPPVKTKASEVLLEGLRNKKTFYFMIPKMVFVQSHDAV